MHWNPSRSQLDSAFNASRPVGRLRLFPRASGFNRPGRTVYFNRHVSRPFPETPPRSRPFGAHPALQLRGEELVEGTLDEGGQVPGRRGVAQEVLRELELLAKLGAGRELDAEACRRERLDPWSGHRRPGGVRDLLRLREGARVTLLEQGWLQRSDARQHVGAREPTGAHREHKDSAKVVARTEAARRASSREREGIRAMHLDRAARGRADRVKMQTENCHSSRAASGSNACWCGGSTR